MVFFPCMPQSICKVLTKGYLYSLLHSHIKVFPCCVYFSKVFLRFSSIFDFPTQLLVGFWLEIKCIILIGSVYTLNTQWNVTIVHISICYNTAASFHCISHVSLPLLYYSHYHYYYMSWVISLRYYYATMNKYSLNY